MAELKLAILNALITYGIPIFVAVLILLAGILFRLGLKLLNRYLKLSFLETLDERIRLSTLALKETVVKDLKEKTKDGKLTEEEIQDSLKKIKEALIQEILGQFGPDLKWVKDIIGDPTKYLADKIEEWVYAHKYLESSTANPSLKKPEGNPQ